jgi:phage terminase large subunit GpA-like protein
LPKGYTANPGRFRPFPFQVEPLNLILDKRYNGETISWANQVLGKTEILNCLIGWTIEAGPGGGIMMIQPTHIMAAAWSKLKLAPLLADLDRVTEEQSFTQKGATAESTIQLKIWDNGFLAIGSAFSPTGLVMYSCRLVLRDEVDNYPAKLAGRGGNVQGDPLLMIERRAETFEDSWIVNTGTMTTKGASRIETELEETDFRKWFVRCPACAHEFVIMFKDIRWQKDRPETAWLECPSCHEHLTDEQRKKMVWAGRWIATKPKVTDNPGFWANAFITVMRCKRKYRSWLHQWAAEWLKAKRKGIETIRGYVNQILNESFEEAGEKPTAPEVLYQRREAYAKGTLSPESFVIPSGALLLVAGIDTQADRFEASLIGVGIGEESWVIDHVVFKGNLAEAPVWRGLLEWLTSRWKHPSGQLLGLAAVGMDSGGHYTQQVYNFVKRAGLRQFWAVRGIGGPAQPWIQRSKSQARLLNVHVDVGKAIIYSRLAMVEPGPGFIHFGQNLDLSYFEQLTSERLVPHRIGGHTVKKFECPPGKRNEALDAFVYGLAALESLRVDWKKLSKRFVTGEPAPDQGIAKQPEEPAPATTEEEEQPAGQAEAVPVAPIIIPHRPQRPRRIWGR